MGKLAVFGGTFNPIHNGHLAIIRALADRQDVDRVLVIPTFVPPHKVCHDLPDGEIRLGLCRIALAGLEKVQVSDLELRRKEKSYTFDTLTELKARYPGQGLALCCGGDMIASLPSWYRYDGILKLAEIFAVRRVGVDAEDFLTSIERIRRDGGQIELLTLAVPELSSTQLRLDPQALKENVPPAVADWIVKHHLYEEDCTHGV